MRVLVADKLASFVPGRLQDLGVEVLVEPKLSGETLTARIGEISPDVVVVRSTKVTRADVERSASLALVVRAGAGVNTIDLAAASERGIYVANCPGKNAVAVAELAMAHLLNLDRRLADNVTQLREGRWNKKELGAARGLRTRTLAVLGAGNIGTEVIKRAQAFGMRVSIWSVAVSEEAAKQLGVELFATPEAAVRGADAVTVHLALVPETRGRIGESIFDAMKPGAYFVNTSRGEVVDQRALEKAITEKGVRAGLDVFEKEPSGAGGRLRGRDREASRRLRDAPHRREHRRSGRSGRRRGRPHRRRLPRWSTHSELREPRGVDGRDARPRRASRRSRGCPRVDLERTPRSRDQRTRHAERHLRRRGCRVRAHRDRQGAFERDRRSHRPRAARLRRERRDGMKARRLFVRAAGAGVIVALGVSGCSASAPNERPMPLVMQPVFTATPPVVVPPTALPPMIVDTSNAAKIRDATLGSSKALDHVTSLVDQVGPRVSGSEASPRAVAWGVAKMKELGLSNVHTEALKEPHWIRGEETADIVAPSPHKLMVTALGGSVATPERGVTAEVVEVESIEALAALPDAAVQGKIVFFHVVMDKTRDGSGYGRAVGARTAGPSAAAKKGAVATVVRTVGTGDDRVPHTGALSYVEGVAKIPGAALSIADAELLHRLDAEGTVKLHLTLLTRELPPVEGANVIGEIPGASAPNEIIVLGAHLDSWELGEGALDDGAGCGIVLEVGRQIALFPSKPKRTVRIVLFANEENGIAGAKAYAKAHEAELPNHYAGIEADLGDGRVYEVTLRGGAEASQALVDYAMLLFPLGAFVGAKEADGGADVSPLRAAGVPVLELRQDATRYFDVHHSANDVLEKIVKGDLDQATAAYAAVTYALADRDGSLGRIPEAERVRQH